MSSGRRDGGDAAIVPYSQPAQSPSLQRDPRSELFSVQLGSSRKPELFALGLSHPLLQLTSRLSLRMSGPHKRGVQVFNRVPKEALERFRDGSA
jgi:hypothetical protein